LPLVRAPSEDARDVPVTPSSRENGIVASQVQGVFANALSVSIMILRTEPHMVARLGQENVDQFGIDLLAGNQRDLDVPPPTSRKPGVYRLT